MAKKEKTKEELLEEAKETALKKLRKQAKTAVAAQKDILKREGIKNGQIEFEITEAVMGNPDFLSNAKEYYLDKKEGALAQLAQVKGFHPFIKGNYKGIAKKCQLVADQADKMIAIIEEYEKEVARINGTPASELENDGDEKDRDEDELGDEGKDKGDGDGLEDELGEDGKGKGDEDELENGGNNGGDGNNDGADEKPDETKKPKKKTPKKKEPKKGEDELGNGGNDGGNNGGDDKGGDDNNDGADEKPDETKKPKKKTPKKKEPKKGEDELGNGGNDGGNDDGGDDKGGDDNNGGADEKPDETKKPKKKEPKKGEDELGNGGNDGGDDNNGGDDAKQDPKKPGLLDNIPKKYYEPIFKLINNTIVLGDKTKFNTLENLEYQLQSADISKLRELGIDVPNNPGRAELIRKIALKFVQASKEIRKDQWLSAVDPKKRGKFEARKHTTQEAIIDRNEKLLRRFNISRAVAKANGLSLSEKDLEDKNNNRRTAKAAINKVKEDEQFIAFYNKIRATYKLDSSNTSEVSLNSIYADLKSENNSFGLTGDALKAAIELVEREILVRRNTYKNGKSSSIKSISSERKSLGLDEPEQEQEK